MTQEKKCSKGGAWVGAGGRRAEAGPQTPVLSTDSPGTHLAAGCLHSEQSMPPVPASWAKNQVATRYWISTHRDRVLVSETAGRASPLPHRESKPGFRWFLLEMLQGGFSIIGSGKKKKAFSLSCLSRVRWLVTPRKQSDFKKCFYFWKCKTHTHAHMCNRYTHTHTQNSIENSMNICLPSTSLKT